MPNRNVVMRNVLTISTAIIFTAVAAACGAGKQPQASSPTQAQSEQQADMPVFAADSAFKYVSAQVMMGPRVPGTEAHRKCAAWIESELMRHGADTVLIQEATVTNPNDGKPLDIKNLLGRYNPDASRRILLVAHYDTRPMADEETDESKRNMPIPGANDGASGVGVMLEIGRQLELLRPEIGVDLLMVDAEDLGISDSDSGEDTSDTWCLGSQYFAKNQPYTAVTMPDMAIVLDMVGGKGAKFHREQFSDAYALSTVDYVWATAARAGYGDKFINKPGGAILDDHLPLVRAGIPAIDIVESHSDVTGSFPPTWHTLSDNMDNIDKRSLEAAGQTVINLIYSAPIKK